VAGAEPGFHFIAHVGAATGAALIGTHSPFANGKWCAKLPKANRSRQFFVPVQLSSKGASSMRGQGGFGTSFNYGTIRGLFALLSGNHTQPFSYYCGCT